MIIIVGFSVLLIMIFVFRYMLSGEVLLDMLILISVYCFFLNLCVKFMFEFKKYFYNFKVFMYFYKYCSYCFLYVESNFIVCLNFFCVRDLISFGNIVFFIEIFIVL